MRRSRAAPALLCIATIAAVASANPAAAATTQIGAVNEIAANTDPDPISVGGFTVQIAEAVGTYAVPAGYRVITAWSHKTGLVAGPLTFKVYRPTGAPKEFRLVAADTRSVTASTLEVFPVRIPVLPGDRIGLSADSVEIAYQTFNLADRVGFFDPDPGPGTTDTTDGEPFPNFKLDVAATVDTDVNGDGVGDSSGPGGVAAVATASRESISPRSFRAAPTGSSVMAAKRAAKRPRYGAKVTYTVNVATAMRFTVRQLLSGRRRGSSKKARCVRETKSNRRGRRCTRTATVKGSFSQVAKAGVNSFRFSGRLGGRRLKPGRYELVATPSVGGKPGKPVTAAFRIIR